MASSKTTSIRLNRDISDQLDKVSHTLHRGKNWIINEALRLYLLKINQTSLADEARRQLLLVSKTKNEDEDLWERNSDTSGWV